MEVDLAWTATGELASVSNHFRIKQPGSLYTFSSKGRSRDAGARGTVAVEGENLTPNDPSYASSLAVGSHRSHWDGPVSPVDACSLTKLRRPAIPLSVTGDPQEAKAMRTPFVAALLSASIAWTPLSSATAQQSTERQTAFESLADSQWVRLAVPDAGRHEGRLLERSSEPVVLSAEPEPLRVPATTIDTLWTRGNAGKTGAIVGAVILGTLGAELAAWVCRRRTRKIWHRAVTSQQGSSCFSAEGLDWQGARCSGASPVSPYLSGTASTPSHVLKNRMVRPGDYP